MLSASLVTASPAHAYYDDAHYALTYYIARLVGYTPLQSWRIASADLSIDWDDDTEPERYAEIGTGLVWSAALAWSRMVAEAFDRQAEAIGWWNVLLADPLVFPEIPDSPDPPTTVDVQDERVAFHAMIDSRIYPRFWDPTHTDWQDGRQAVLRRRQEFFEQVAWNPGAFLHYLQDETPHDGYPSWGGHWAGHPGYLLTWIHQLVHAEAAERYRVAASYYQDHPLGPTTDYLTYGSPDRHARMIQDTIAYLARFMRERIPNQRLRDARYVGGEEDVLPLLQEIRERLPLPEPLNLEEVSRWVGRTFEQSDQAATARAIRANLPTQEDLAAFHSLATGVSDYIRLRYDELKELSPEAKDPNELMRRVTGAIERAFRRRGECFPFPRVPIMYPLSPHGDPFVSATTDVTRQVFPDMEEWVETRGEEAETELDPWTLYGRLNLHIRPEDSYVGESPPVEVVVKAPPTFLDEEEYELDRREDVRIDLQSGTFVEFERLPVTDTLIVEIWLGERRIARKVGGSSSDCIEAVPGGPVIAGYRNRHRLEVPIPTGQVRIGDGA